MPVLIAVPSFLALLLGLASYPLGAPLWAAGLLTYGILLWRWPALWLFVVPALLPALDLSPFTGRLPLDEFDLVVLVTLAVVSVRVRRTAPAPWPHPLLAVAAALLWLTWGVATARGLWPLFGAGDTAAGSHSPLDAWLVGKGLLWALLFVPLLRRVPREEWEAARSRVLGGLVVGLCIVTLAVLWERHVFVGLLDFENVFRVTGTFSNMNTGGAYIEAFLAFAFPALAVWVLGQRSWASKFLGIVAAGLASYAMLVTFSRGGYAGLAAGLLVVVFGALRHRSGVGARRWLALAGLAVASVAVAVPVLSGGFAQSRLKRVAEDLAIRRAHWGRALRLMDNGLFAAVTGMGFGQYPTRYLQHAGSRVPPGTYRVLREGENTHLRLHPGEPVYLDQLVGVRPGEHYVLSARLRQPGGQASLSVALCEKALLYSFGCLWKRLEPQKPGEGWTAVTVPVDGGNLGGGGSWPRRPVKLSLHNGSRNPIDVDDVSLRGQDGRELLANGDFSKGAARWLFVTDQDLAWHIHEQWMEMYFAQGLLGLAAAVILLIGVGTVLWPQLLAGDLRAAAFSAALAGFLAVGLLGSTMDTARISMLFYLGAFCAGILGPGEEGRRRAFANQR